MMKKGGCQQASRDRQGANATLWMYDTEGSKPTKGIGNCSQRTIASGTGYSQSYVDLKNGFSPFFANVL
jgi:hypothetical protein